MSDDLDKEYTPNGRPQSTMARSFSLALNELFKIDDSIADLDAKVFEKKQALSSQTSELEALEARLRATEERLKARQAASAAPSRQSTSGRSSPRPQAPIAGNTFAQTATRADKSTNPPSSEVGNRIPVRPATRGSSSKELGTPSRPSSGWKQENRPSHTAPPMPEDMPPTSGASEDGGMPPPPPPRSAARRTDN